MNKDIFISYRNDGEGNNFAVRLFDVLDAKNYSVYFNSKEQHCGSFPDRLKEAIENCRDFILIVSAGCLEGLQQDCESDWVRFEILYAQEKQKNITPVYIGKTVVPERWGDYPEDIRFLFALQSVYLPEQFELAPISDLFSKFVSKPEKEDVFRSTYNSNPHYNPDADLEILLQRANSGDVSAMYEVALFYNDGFTRDKNYALAYKWFLKVTQSTDEQLKALAHAHIANLYFSGAVPGQEQSFVEAYEHRKLAAKKDEWSAQQNAAMSRRGSGVHFDFNEIEKNFKSLKNRDSISVAEQAKFYLQYGMFEKAIELYLEVKDQMPEASYHLGLLYKLGVHVSPPYPDCFRAAEFFRRAAEDGNRDASYELGMLYYNPPLGDFTKDFPVALKYFKIAADAGHAEAQHLTGWFYRNGLGCKKDFAESIRYNQMAADQGNIGGIGSLIYLYQAPGFVNYHKAYKYAEISAKAGVNNGAYHLGNLLFFGRGCEANLEEALKWYKMAYDHGYTDARIMIEKVQMVLKDIL